MADRTMTLNLSDAEMKVVEELAKKLDLSKTAVIRQALRLYQSIRVRCERGETIMVRQKNGDTHEWVFLV